MIRRTWLSAASPVVCLTRQPDEVSRARKNNAVDSLIGGVEVEINHHYVRFSHNAANNKIGHSIHSLPAPFFHRIDACNSGGDRGYYRCGLNNHQVNPLSKVSIFRNFDSKGSGLTSRIGIDPTSMHRHRSSIPQSPCVIDDQPRIHPFNVIVGRRIVEGAVRKVCGLVKKLVGNLFIHSPIVCEGQGGGYSYFPIGVVHVANVAARQE